MLPPDCLQEIQKPVRINPIDTPTGQADRFRLELDQRPVLEALALGDRPANVLGRHTHVVGTVARGQRLDESSHRSLARIAQIAQPATPREQLEQHETTEHREPRTPAPPRRKMKPMASRSIDAGSSPQPAPVHDFRPPAKILAALEVSR